MGLYPVDPVSGRYEIGTPLFEKLTLRLDNGKTLTINAPGVSSENKYVKSVKLNGEPLKSTSITQQQIMDGAVIDFEMTSQPGIVWYK